MPETLNTNAGAPKGKHSANGPTLLRELIDSTSDGIVVVDPLTLHYLDANQTACDMFGYSRAELLATSIRDMNVGWNTSVEPQLEETDSAKFECSYQRKDGSTYPAEVHIRRVRLERSYNVVVIRDISERKRSERERDFQNAILSTQQETSLDAILVVDKDGRILSYNRRFIELWELSEDIIKTGQDERALHSVLHKIKDSSAFLARVRHLYDNPDEVSREDVELTDGRILDRYSAPVIGSDGTQYGRVWYFRDVTERKQATRDLNRLNWALQALSRSNSALVRADNKKALFALCCEAIAGVDAYPLAWVGSARNDATRSIEILAAAGDARGYLDGLQASWDNSAPGCGPAGTAIRTGTIQVIPDISGSAACRPWHERARASGLASLVVIPICPDDTVFGVLIVYSRELAAFGDEEVRLLEKLADDIGYGIRTRNTQRAYQESLEERAKQADKLRATFESVITALAATVEQRDPYTAGHQRRVADLAVAIARELGLDEDRIEGLRIASTIHDIGKTAIPGEILTRPGRLSPLEFEMVNRHAQFGYDIVKAIDFPWPVAQAIYQHHERLDGSGYPRGLKGDAIILEARIIAVADTVEAMSSHRPYRVGLGVEKALAQVKAEAGITLDANVVSACVKLLEKNSQAPGKATAMGAILG